MGGKPLCAAFPRQCTGTREASRRHAGRRRVSQSTPASKETKAMDTSAPVKNGAVPVTGTTASRKRFSITITPRSIWMAAAAVVAILVGLLLLSKALGTLVLLLLAIILGEAIRPLVARLQRYRIPGAVAILLIYVVALSLIGVVLWLLLDPFTKEVSSLTQHVPQYVKEVQQWVAKVQTQLRAEASLEQAVNSLAQSAGSSLQQSAPALLGLPVTLVTGVFGVFISLVVVLTMTLFWLTSTQALKPFVVGLFPVSEQERASSVISEIGQSFGGYVRGALISMVLIGLLTGLGLLLLGVPYAVLLGAVAGLTELLPYIGPWLSGTIVGLVALVAAGPLKAGEVILLFLLIQQIEGNVVQPLVMSRAVHVNPLLVIVAVLIRVDMLVVIGADLGVPIVGTATGVVVPEVGSS